MIDGAAEVRIPLRGDGIGVSEPFDGCPISVTNLVLVIEAEGELSDDGKTLRAETVKRVAIETSS